MSTQYQPIADRHFSKGFAPDLWQRADIDKTVSDRCFEIVQAAYSESEDGLMMSNHPGWGAGGLPATFRDAFKGKRGLTVSKIEWKDYADSPFNGQFNICVQGDGWFSIVFVYVAFDLGDRTNDDGSTQYADTFGEVLLRGAYEADDEAAYRSMLRWWKTVDVSKKLFAA